MTRQVRRRFGATTAEQTLPLLAGISDLEQLEELGDQLLICADGDEWLQTLRSAGASHAQ